MKYTATEYVALSIWDDDDGASNVVRSVVKTRKPQTCTAGRGHDMPSGTMALCEKAIIPGEGRVSCYACTDCLDRIIDKNAKYEATGEYA